MDLDPASWGGLEWGLKIWPVKTSTSQVSRVRGTPGQPGPGLPGQDPFPVQPDLTEFPQARIRQSDLDSG